MCLAAGVLEMHTHQECSQVLNQAVLHNLATEGKRRTSALWHIALTAAGEMLCHSVYISRFHLRKQISTSVDRRGL